MKNGQKMSWTNDYIQFELHGFEPNIFGGYVSETKDLTGPTREFYKYTLVGNFTTFW